MNLPVGNCKRCGTTVRAKESVEEEIAHLLHQDIKEIKDVVLGENPHLHYSIPSYCEKCEKLLKNQVY